MRGHVEGGVRERLEKRERVWVGRVRKREERKRWDFERWVW